MKRAMVKVQWVVLAAALGACGEAAPGDEAWATDEAAIVEGSAEAAGVLRVANTLDFATLDVDVGLDARAARNIVERRGAGYPTLAALEAVPYVGDIAIGRMQTYAERQGWIEAAPPPPEGAVIVNGVAEGSAEARAILGLANTAPAAVLDVDAGLDIRAVSHIVARRPFADLAALDAVPYVTATAFQRLLAYAGTAAAPPAPPAPPAGPPYQDTPVVLGVREGSYEGLALLRVANEATLAQLDDDAGLDARAAKAIFHTRAANGAYRTLGALDAVPNVGQAAFDRMLAYARQHNLLTRCGDRVVQPVMEQCDGGVGCDAQCRFTYHCGDGALEVGEQCDDGNAASRDGCSAQCRTELLYESADNRSIDTADDLRTFREVAGRLDGEGDRAYIRFTLDRPTRVRIDVAGGDTDRCVWFGFLSPVGVYHSDLFDPDAQIRDANDRPIASFDTNCGRRAPDLAGYDMNQLLQPGTYYLRLEGQDVGGGWDSEYRIGYNARFAFEAAGPVCGNGRVEAPEACDDGNPASGDGCSQQCAVETLAEVEPNDAPQGARALGTYVFASGDIHRAGDEDWWAVHVPAGGGLLAEVSDGAGGCDFDARLEVFDAAGVQIAWDDDDGPGYCPRLDSARDPAVRALPGGVYTLRVRHADARLVGAPYRLEVRVR